MQNNLLSDINTSLIKEVLPQMVLSDERIENIPLRLRIFFLSFFVHFIINDFLNKEAAILLEKKVSSVNRTPFTRTGLKLQENILKHNLIETNKVTFVEYIDSMYLQILYSFINIFQNYPSIAAKVSIFHNEVIQNRSFSTVLDIQFTAINFAVSKAVQKVSSLNYLKEFNVFELYQDNNFFVPQSVETNLRVLYSTIILPFLTFFDTFEKNFFPFVVMQRNLKDLKKNTYIEDFFKNGLAVEIVPLVADKNSILKQIEESEFVSNLGMYGSTENQTSIFLTIPFKFDTFLLKGFQVDFQLFNVKHIQTKMELTP
jgi:hypothetical protein